MPVKHRMRISTQSWEVIQSGRVKTPEQVYHDRHNISYHNHEEAWRPKGQKKQITQSKAGILARRFLQCVRIL